MPGVTGQVDYEFIRTFEACLLHFARSSMALQVLTQQAAGPNGHCHGGTNTDFRRHPRPSPGNIAAGWQPRHAAPTFTC
jgi:hypothetical protein